MPKITSPHRKNAAALATFALATAALSLTTGCSSNFTGGATAPVIHTAVIHGNVHGGQQPVSGATIQLYAANQLAYGQAATPLIGTAVTTGPDGSFNVTGAYTCPYSNSLVYITATGGNPGLSGNNPNLALMAALGPCGNLGAATYVSVNELTTVASAYALAPFMSSLTQLSTSATNVTGLTNAFSTVNKLVNTANGGFTGNTLPAGATEPINELNTLSNALASCVNSAGGFAGDGTTNCGTLFTAATLSGSPAPTDTVTAILNIAKAPASNVTSVYTLASPTGPFQPTLTAQPTAFTVSVRYAPTATFSTPSASALDTSGNLWVTNAGNNTIALLSAAASTPSVLSGGTLNAPSGIAFDAAGNAWVPNKGNSSLSVFTPSGTGSVALSSSLSAPSAVAIDAQGLIWVTDSGNNSVTVVTPSGTTVTAATAFATSGINAPVAVAINPR